MRRLVQTSHAATKGAADERALLAADETADTRTGSGRSTDDERALAPRSVRTMIDVSSLVVAGRVRSVIDVPHARHSRCRLAPMIRVADDSVLSRTARHDHR